MKYLKIFLFLLIPLSVLFLFQNANGILVGDGREETDVILVGNVLSFVENKTSLETSYLVEVEKYLKTPKNYDANTKTANVISSGLRKYDDPQQARVYERLFNVNDRVLFLLYQKDGILRESLYSQTTKSNCLPQQLLDEMYGEYGLHISQNNQTRHFYTNQPIDLTFYGYNTELIAKKKDFEFKVNVPITGKILSEKTQLDFQSCKRTASASWSFIPTVAGKYGFHSIIGNNEGGSESFSGFLIEDYVEPPQKQIKAGVHLEDIKCRDSLFFVIKYDRSPACVKIDTTTKLIQRGWVDSDEYTVNLAGGVDLDPVQGDSLKQEILTQLRKEPKNLNANAKEFILSEALSDKRVSDLLGDTKFQTFWTINSELGESPIKYYYGITFQLNEKNEVNVVYDLQEEKITTVEGGEAFGSSSGEEIENICKENNELDLVRIPQIGNPSRLVFSVKQNTTAHICIKYSSMFENEGSLDLNEGLIEGYLTTYNGTKSNVSASINPRFIPLQNGQSEIADYAIYVPQGTDGVFWLGVSQMCDRIPIGTTNHRIIPDDIPVIVGMHSCPAIMLDAKIIGYSNADAQYHVAKALPGR